MIFPAALCVHIETLGSCALSIAQWPPRGVLLQDASCCASPTLESL